MLIKEILFFGQPATVSCDENCGKAWGKNSRPRVQLSDDEDDYAYLCDGELGDAPDDPGTYEGADAKPTSPEEKMNKRCVRECERCAMSDIELNEIPTTPDFSTRRKNNGTV